MPKLTKRLIEATAPAEKDILLRDNEVKGFLCKVTPSGKRTYMLYYRTADGRERKPAIGTHGQITCEQAREIAKQWMAEVAKGNDPSLDKQKRKTSLTLADMGAIYLNDRAPYIKPKSLSEFQRTWRAMIVPAIGHLKASHIDNLDIRKFHLANKHRPYMANRAFELIRMAFNYAIDNKIIPPRDNPCKGIRKYKEQKRERFLSMEEIQRLSDTLRQAEQNHTQHLSMIALVRLLLFTGCRLSEILTLKWQYIDVANHCLRLPDSKTGAKTVYLSPAALQVLQQVQRMDGNPYVITGNIENMHMVSVQKAWQRIRKQAGLEDVRLHDLRHSFASIGAANGLSLPMIGALLGHSNTQTTARYAHLVGDPLKQAAAMIGDKITDAMRKDDEQNHSNNLVRLR